MKTLETPHAFPSTTPLIVEYLATEQLKPYPRNARTHTRAQIRKIADSIRSFGFTNPVLLDKDNTIVAGHGRIAAAKQLGLERVPTIRLDALTSVQVQAYILADNRLAEDAGWDEDILRIELQNLVFDASVDIELTGFEVPEIDLILKDPVLESDPADELPPEQGEAITRLGDIWLLGSHRVFCGDVRDAAAIEVLMNGKQADMVFTDPPYNVEISDNVSGKGAVKHQDFAMAVGEMSAEEFTNFLTETLGALARRCTDRSVHFVCMDWRHMNELLSAGDKVYNTLLNLCVWVKNGAGQGSFYRSRHELVFVFRNGKATHQNHIQLGRFGRYRSNVWEYPSISGLKQRQGDEGNLLALHPTVKPVAMVADAILDCTARGDLILDGFLGSGSTLIAAERVDRICYGVELDPRYVDVAIRRWQRHTGETAVNAASGRSFTELETEANAHG